MLVGTDVEPLELRPGDSSGVTLTEEPLELTEALELTEPLPGRPGAAEGRCTYGGGPYDWLELSFSCFFNTSCSLSTSPSSDLIRS